MTRLPWARQKATESAIIARFSSRETFVTFSRCSAQVLPTSVDHRRKALDQGAQSGVVLDRGVAAAGHTEGADRRLLQLQLGEQTEQLDLLRVGAWEASLDQLHAEGVEGTHYADLLGRR